MPEPEAAAAWLAAFGVPGADPAALGVAFAPATYKQVLDGALALGRAAGRLPEAIRVLAEGEARLRRLRDHLGLTRRDREAGGLPRVAVIERLDPLTLAGRWVPDLVAHAGGRSVLVASGEPSLVVSAAALADAEVDALVVLSSEDSQVLRDVSVGRVYAFPPALLLVPGPNLIAAAEALAAALHPEAVEPEGSDRR